MFYTFSCFFSYSFFVCLLVCLLLRFLPPIVFAFVFCIHNSLHMLLLYNVIFHPDKQARNDAYKARVGPWMAALEARATEVLPLVKGLDPDERALRVQQLRQRALNVVEVDYSRFDRHCTTKLLQNTEHLVYRHCFPEAIYRLLADQLTTTCKLRHNAVTYRGVDVS